MDPRTGLDVPFQLLFTDETAPAPSLPAVLRAAYPGDWHPPQVDGRPYIYTNFATSRDGRISYNDPAYPGGGPVSIYNAHDRWLMALLRMRADAVMVGDVTLATEPDHAWTAAFIFPDAADLFDEIRHAEGYPPKPRLVFLSYTGKLDFDAACWRDAELEIIIATTEQGAQHASAALASLGDAVTATVTVLALGADAVDLPRLARVLHADHGVRRLLCEGGARVFANLLDAHLVDEEFVTLSPSFVGRTPELFRPSYTEGVAWLPPTAPRSVPLSLHRVRDHLFLRTRCVYPEAS
ncbi:MAG: dihydrofolate reductase family protein [Caldilineaceae bacterium]|nr:dihydrofolate reductase family protein [Caldilineaceae bacterium]MCB9160066.1 dihydrofolate reductase family protein [Caldilineaceae bacterium]